MKVMENLLDDTSVVGWSIILIKNENHESIAMTICVEAKVWRECPKQKIVFLASLVQIVGFMLPFVRNRWVSTGKSVSEALNIKSVNP